MKSEEATSGNIGRRVIAFRPRRGAVAPAAIPTPAAARDHGSPVSDLTRFERTEAQDDYRQRMIVNAAALVFTVVLAAAGIWIAESMAIMRKNQDCVLMGRRACGPVVVPVDNRRLGTVSGQRP